MDYKFEDKTVKELLRIAYKDYGIPEDGGQGNNHVKVEFTKHFYVYIPNFAARKAVVMKHDAHHLITRTPFNLVGETEIAMWEIAGGCWNHWFAFAINSTIIPLGFFINLRRMFRACIAGRRSQTLYDNRYDEATFLNMKAVALHQALQVQDYHQKATLGDCIVFTAWLLACGLVNLLAILVLPFLLLYNIYVFTMVRPQVT